MEEGYGKVTIPRILNMKRSGEKIAMITAYDYPTALLADQAGVDIVLVGDSVGIVMLGYPSTLPVTMSDIIHHARAVVRGVRRALIVCDMPFMSYQAGVEKAVRNAGRFLKIGCDAVKVEGGAEVEKVVRAIVDAGIPVMGHIGLTPQRYAMLGGYRVQGVDAGSAERIVRDAETLESAGAFSIVLEFTVTEVAEMITRRLDIPTICIGSGPHCEGQVVVVTDILGITSFAQLPKYTKQYANLRETILSALRSYVGDVKKRAFPSDEHSYHMAEGELEKLRKMVGEG